ncbi:head GIN domain-containing protein [Mangrovibacterium diazotrophicum]|uniref:Putative autotransporter adhesin-like protein n=1 Tax=Mangrovibacterium diazotrophicum TaxID=1261403 RepID=A0A419W977_9BACT|nr:head GIN domain-containing protein [Mangrovibacterium diazotrophicum]RKD92013.1 putative autotransporter adhesin-like protein [Mangrovibacterium diazotrophicum]
MKKTILFSGIFVLTILLHSCILLGPSVKGDGDVTEETRQISGFEKIEASTGLEVLLIPDSTEFVIVETDENLHEHIQTELSHKTLKIFTESRIRWAKSKKVKVHYITLNELKSSSGAQVRSEGSIETRDIEVHASSGSQQHLEVIAKTVDGRCSSGAHIYVSGKSERADLKASSGAHLKAGDLWTSKCDADASSGAHIWIAVSDELNAEASSGGHVYYSGNPEKTNGHSSSGGVISKD